MNHQRFDDLIRTIVSRRSRRRFAGMAVTLLGGLLVNPLFDGAHDVLAKNKRGKGKKKRTARPASAAARASASRTTAVARIASVGPAASAQPAQTASASSTAHSASKPTVPATYAVTLSALRIQ